MSFTYLVCLRNDAARPFGLWSAIAYLGYGSDQEICLVIMRIRLSEYFRGTPLMFSNISWWKQATTQLRTHSGQRGPQFRVWSKLLGWVFILFPPGYFYLIYEYYNMLPCFLDFRCLTD